MSSRDLAWKQRVLQEDKQLLAKVIDARRRLAESPALVNEVDGMAIRTRGFTPSLGERPNNKVAPPIGSSVKSTVSGGGSTSVAPSNGCRSSTSTQLSHHGVSTVQGSIAISQLSIFSTRLEKLEHRLEEERRERKRVVDELAEIKQLLISQRLQQQAQPSRTK